MAFWNIKKQESKPQEAPETFEEALNALDQDMAEAAGDQEDELLGELLGNLDEAQTEEETIADDAEEFHESALITMDFPDGSRVDYELLGVFRTEDDRRQYMALHPLGTGDDSAVELSPFDEGPDGEVAFVDFIDDDEYEYAAELFEKYFIQDEDEEIL